MAANSFKLMSRSGVIKRSDTGMYARWSDIHVKEGFNSRDDDERTRKADDELFDYLMNGGTVPPLEVAARDDGGVWIVEGHRRHRCYGRCLDAGKPVEWIHIVPFVGNDVERSARVITSSSQLLLSPIEQARKVKDMAVTFNLTSAELSKYLHKSVTWVERLMALSTANHDVQLAVKSGEVSLDVALDRVREYGESAGKVLAQDVAAAAAAGKKRVTKKQIAPEVSVKSARRLVELISKAGIDDSGVVTLEGLVLAEVLAIVDEHKAISAQREKTA